MCGRPPLLSYRAVNMTKEGSMNLLKEAEVAKFLDVSVQTLRRWRLLARGPQYHKLNGCVRYSADQIREFLAQRAVTSTGGVA